LQGLSYKEIAKERNLGASTIAGHMEQLILEGHHIEIKDHLSEEKILQIKELFTSLKTEKLTPVIEASGNSVEFEEARLVRAVMGKI
jgi:ATP-dependent DNA helicase RecQ